MSAEETGRDTPVNLPAPTPAEIERDRLRRLREEEMEKARAAADAERQRALAQRLKDQERVAKERVAREREMAQEVAEAAARARQAQADAQGVVLAPTGKARKAMLTAIGIWLGVSICWYLGATGVLPPAEEFSHTPLGQALRVLRFAILFLASLVAWYLWWVGLVAFLADKVGDAVAKRLVPHLRGSKGDRA